MEIKINITDVEEKILLNDLIDIQDWVEKAVKGKVNNCKKRMISGYKSPLVDKTDDELVEYIISQLDYKDRKDRELDSE